MAAEDIVGEFEAVVSATFHQELRGVENTRVCIPHVPLGPGRVA